MSILDKFNESDFVYSIQIDWGLKKYDCDVLFFTEEPLNDLFFVICSLIQSNGGEYDKRLLGLKLGFSVVDLSKQSNNIIYYDVAEERLFDDIIKRVVKERLIIEKDDALSLTELGKISLKEEKHYRFFKGTQNVFEHLKVNTNMPMALLMFPFYEDMGIFSQLQMAKQIWPEDGECYNIIYHKTNPLIKRLEKQSKEYSNVYDATLSKFFDIDSRLVKINLYEKDGEYFPVVMRTNDEAAEKATALVNNGLNDSRKENYILRCLFQKLWDDPNSIFDFPNIEPYVEYIDYKKLVNRETIVWTDKRLFQLIVERAEQDCWKTISRKCDVSILCENLDLIQDKLDWAIFTERIDDQFLINNFKAHTWDLEVISNDNKRSLEVIKALICQEKETTEDWDWEALAQRFKDDKDFVISHLSLLDINLFDYTEDTENIRTAILQNPDRLWDWDKIEREFSIVFIGENISELGVHFNGETLLDRIFTDPKLAKSFLGNDDFVSFVTEQCKEDGLFVDIVLNNKNYIWTNNDIISFFIEHNLIYWESTQYVSGFECNPFIKWSKQFFKKYSSFVVTEQGFGQVSNKIEDLTIINQYPTFRWNWDMISANPHLIKTPELYSNYGENLNWAIVLENIKDTDTAILETIADIDRKIADDSVAWSAFSKMVSIDYIRNHFTYNWDWHILTKRIFANLHLDRLGHRMFVDKWDWDYLSENVPDEFLHENLEKYGSYWNWTSVLNRIFDIYNNIEQSSLNKFASVFATIQNDDKRAAAWTALTKSLSFEQLLEWIPITASNPDFEWDTKYFSCHDKFDIRKHLPSVFKFVDWETLSSSASAKRVFTFNGKQGKQYELWLEPTKKLLDNINYHWDFKQLSKISYLIDQDWFVSKYRALLDWQIISFESSLFAETNEQRLNELIEAYKSYLDFTQLSHRCDVKMEQIIKIYPYADYDFNALIENGTLPVTQWIKQIKLHRDYNWDFYAITSSSEFEPEISFLQLYIDKDLNWEYLSSRDLKNVWNNEKFITQLSTNFAISNRINWNYLSSLNEFPIDKELFMSLPLEHLNWSCLSQQKKIIEILDIFPSLVDWKVISSNPEFNISDNTLLNRYKDYLDWHVICGRNDFTFNNDIIKTFADYIDWDLASCSITIDFDEDFVRAFEDRWNWSILTENKAFHNRLDAAKFDRAKNLNISKFLQQFRGHTPKAYHFTHMSNAVKIIKSMKLQSRNLASGNFDNSAGANVHRTSKAHRYARFYFAPQSPTQFYNEFLGIESGSKYYDAAKKLGLPKCPLPVFFVFDVEEILLKMPSLCFYSNGNMQKDSSKSFMVIEAPEYIRTRGIYINSRETMNERQQEFLIDGELDFSKLNKVQICVFDEAQKSLLIEALGSSKWIDYIYVRPSLYIGKNHRLEILESEDEIDIQTKYQDSFEYRVSFDSAEPTILNTHQITQQKGKNIFMRNSVKIKKTVPFNIYFEVRWPRVESWLIYQYGNSDKLCSHQKLTLNDDIKQSLEEFESRMNGLPIKLTSGIFYPHMVNSFHGIGHTSRVLLYSFLLATSIDLSDEEIVASCVAAITHDIGKRNDMDGASHGYASMLKIHDRIGSYIHDTQLAQRVLNAVRYHSVEDKDCPNKVRVDIIWKLLKDADALDRSRFMRGGCNKSYLRLGIYNTEIGQNILDLASYLPSWTQSLKWNEPYQELIQQINKYCE